MQLRRHESGGLTLRANALIPARSPIFIPPMINCLAPFSISSSIKCCSTGRKERQCTSPTQMMAMKPSRVG